METLILILPIYASCRYYKVYFEVCFQRKSMNKWKFLWHWYANFATLYLGNQRYTQAILLEACLNIRFHLGHIRMKSPGSRKGTTFWEALLYLSPENGSLSPKAQRYGEMAKVFVPRVVTRRFLDGIIYSQRDVGSKRLELTARPKGRAGWWLPLLNWPFTTFWL